MGEESNNVTFSVVSELDALTGAALFASMREYRNGEPHVSATAWLDAGIPTGSRILELGPGTGEDADRLVREEHTVTGVDVRTDLCVPQGWVLLQGSATSLPVEEASMDIVRANRVIHHVDPHLDFLREARRVLVPSGAVLMSFPERTMTKVSDPEVENILKVVMTMKNVDTYNPVLLPYLIKDCHETGFPHVKVVAFQGTFYGENVFTYGFPKPLKHAAAAREYLGAAAGDKLEWFARECEEGRGSVTVTIVCVEAGVQRNIRSQGT